MIPSFTTYHQGILLKFFSTQSSHPIVLFDWQPSRRADHPREFLKKFSGAVVTDGYQVYHKLGRERQDLTVGGCWIHARRPFADFIKSVKDSGKGTIAAEAYAMITEMLHIDNEFDVLSAEDRQKQRQFHLLTASTRSRICAPFYPTEKSPWITTMQNRQFAHSPSVGYI